MPEALLSILKFFLVALIYLFFFRVLRAVWAEVTAVPRPAAAAGGPPAPAPRASRPQSGKPVRLRIVEPPDHRGAQFDLGEELTVGRADGCRIRLDDSFTSQLHARVFSRDGQFFVEDLGSTNGTFVNGSKIAAAAPLRRGDRIKIGKTTLEVTK
ncbi:MAG: FHA domain-containing protein [Acidimicrobiia bacterium]